MQSVTKRCVRCGENHHNWQGGRMKRDGYILILKPEHPYCDYNGYVREHRLVMEKHLGRYLTKLEFVHHINENRSDNRIENLMIMTPSQHGQHHNPQKDLSNRICNDCGSTKTRIHYGKNKYGIIETPEWYHDLENNKGWLCRNCHARQKRRIKKQQLLIQLGVSK